MLSCAVVSKQPGRPRRLELNAAAKVNLVLEVLGRRDDGYHEIATVMQAVDLSDRLVLEDADVLELRTTAPDVPTDGTNLALRAALALREVAGNAAHQRDGRIPPPASGRNNRLPIAEILFNDRCSRKGSLGHDCPREL